MIRGGFYAADIEASRRPSPLLTIAPALAAILGAAVGGFFTYQGSLSAQRAETERQEDREDAQARGAARVLMAEYDDAEAWLAATANEGVTIPIGEDAMIRLPRDEAQLLASHLTPKQWQQVTRTNGLVRDIVLLIETYNRSNKRPVSRGGALLDPSIEKSIDQVGPEVDRGRVALAPIADIPVVSSRPPK